MEKKKLLQRMKGLLAVIGIGLSAYWIFAGLFGERAVTVVSAQNGDPYLSRRIDQIENRFYGIESRLTRIEMQATSSGITSPIARTDDTDVQFLRSQVDSMRVRLGEAECALLRLDERTLTPAVRAARKKATISGTDRCREDRDDTIQLSARP